jgi:hypothetical protein
MLTEDELRQARAVPVLEIAQHHGARLKRSGKQFEGPCPVCGGVDRFWVVPSLNVGGCRGSEFAGDAIALEMHLSRRSFVDAVKALISEDAGTSARRHTTPDENKARDERGADEQRVAAEEKARNDGSAAKILVRLQPVAGTPGETYLREVRRIDVTHWAIRRALTDVETLGWSERTYFRQEDPGKMLHEFHGQQLGAIIGILTDPITGTRTGGITRTFVHQGRKLGKAMSLGGTGRPGVIRLSPDDEVLGGLHLCEGLESAMSAMMMGFVPMWAAGSASQIKSFPLLAGIRCVTIIADNDIKDGGGRAAGQEAAREACRRWAGDGREAVMKKSKRLGEDPNDIVRRRTAS